MFDRYDTSRHIWLVLEYCPGGNLQNVIGSDGALPETNLLSIATEVASALQYAMHAWHWRMLDL